MLPESRENLFVVVEVQAGVAVGAECFSDLVAARRRAEQVRAEYNVNDDDVEVFEATIKTSA